MRTLIAAMTATVLASAAGAAPTIEYLTPGYFVSDLSADGSVYAGNVIFDFSYETFRWTAEEGFVRLGRATVPVIGTGAGSPDISYDGTKVSATILSSDNRATQGIWSETGGWVETMPPSPPGGIVLDNGYGSAWGLSGDGTTVTGFYWRSGPGSAHASAWTQADGMLPMETTPGRSARVNGANYDGSVAVGWEERMDGVWEPRVWINGVKSTLVVTEGFSGAEAVNADGSVIVGSAWDASAAKAVATIWRWNGSSYDTQYIGALPGTAANFGGSYFTGVSDDGSIAVGGNRFGQSPGGPVDAIIWTPETGLMNGVDFIASLGLALPPNTDLRGFYTVSADGQVITGDLLRGADVQSFIIRLTNCPADINGDELVDFADLNLLLGNFNTSGPTIPGDINGDGVVNFADLNLLLSVYNTACD